MNPGPRRVLLLAGADLAPAEIARQLEAGAAVWLDPGPAAAGRVAAVARALLDHGIEIEIAPGAVAGLAGAIAAAGGLRAWLEGLALAGRRVVVTRAQAQAGDLSALLEAWGAETLELATISIEPPEDPRPLEAALERLGTYDWLIFSSANGVKFFLERLDASALDVRALGAARLCAIGPGTAEALARAHLKVDRIPREYVAESLVEAFAGEDLRGRRILLPRAQVARDLLPAELRKRGARVDVVEAYRTVAPAASARRARELFSSSGPKPDWITFTSSSTVKNFVALAGADALAGVRVASIGPVTSASARECGLKVTVEAAEHTIPGLVRAIVEHHAGGSGPSR